MLMLLLLLLLLGDLLLLLQMCRCYYCNCVLPLLLSQPLPLHASHKATL